MEREMVGKDMISFVDSGKDAAEGHPLAGLDLLLDRPILVTTSYLAGWYNEGHGITDGYDDNHGVWIPTHGPLNGLFFCGYPHLPLMLLRWKSC